MRAMILAAGRGERMRPLTDSCPKPMLQAGGRPLIVHHIEALAAAGVHDIVINHAWLGHVIVDGLGDGSAWGVRLHHSPEAVALETAGGIVQALPLLGADAAPHEPFLVLAGDVWCDWPVGQAAGIARRMVANGLLAWCLMVDNPPHHPAGDFVLDGGRLRTAGDAGDADVDRNAPDADPAARDAAAPRLTYAGIGLFTAALFDGLAAGQRSPLRPWLERAMVAGRVGGRRHDGLWSDVGTPQRLDALRLQLDPPAARPRNP